MALSDAIKQELMSRGDLSPALLRSPVDSFDQETEIKLHSLRYRHRVLQRDFAEKWQADMKDHYFAPTVRLQTLRQEAIDLLGEGRRSESTAVAEAAAEVEAQEARAAQGQFQKDYDALCARMQRKRDREVEGFTNERLKKRSALLRIAARRPSVSNTVSPRALRL
jgi:hypothetical protein